MLNLIIYITYKIIIMENKAQNEVKDLLGNITDFKSELLSGEEEMENPDGKSVEKYFNIKLKTQLDAKDSYSNIKIVISDFLEELRLYMFGKTFNNEKLDKKIAKTILDEIGAYLKDETEIEIDSFYPYISGEKINQFFKLTTNYSYPTFVKINPGDKYTVVVESTYCLKKNIIKKCEQLRKNFLFFSILNKFYKKYDVYLEDFYEFFIKRHIFIDKNIKSVYDYKKDVNFDLSSFDNYIILFVTNSKFDFFNEVKLFLEQSKPLVENEIEFNIEKCFQFPLPKVKCPKIESKKFSEIEDNNLELPKNEEEKKKTQKSKKGEPKLFYSYRKFRHLINNINMETNFKIKIIYLDLYLNVLAPKCEIVAKLDNLNNKLSAMGNELEETKRTLDSLVNFIKSNNPSFNLDNLK